MTERLLHYIWQFQYLNNKHLLSTQGEKIQVIQTGTLNTNQGPDFTNAKIKVGHTVWAGNVELHINASDWWAHKHSNDKNYKNVMLHVVWYDDAPEELPFPTLVLQEYVSGILLNKYEELMQSPQFIPCQHHIKNISALSFTAWKERLLIERLQHRAHAIEKTLLKNNYHWEETFWWMLARNFGIKINADAFEKIAHSIPINLLARHKTQIHQLEALLMGQGAMLDKKFAEDYPNMLRKEYTFLQKKYGLQKAHAPLYFLRMRPANFPSLRLAQLAMLIHQSHHLFSLVKESASLKKVQDLLKVTANDYWHYHYMFDETSAYKKKTLGKDMIQNICINTVIPVLYAYGYINNNELYKDKALLWMEALSAEKNSISKGFEQLGVTCTSAFDSQALIQLKNEYCNYKHCLQCAVGNQVLKG